MNFEPDGPGVPRSRQVLGRALVPTMVLLPDSLDHQVAALVDPDSGKWKVALRNAMLVEIEKCLKCQKNEDWPLGEF